MKKNKAISWLYKELPDLVAENVITQDAALKIKEHYGQINQKSKIQVALSIFSVIGAVCLGIGVILIFAHNWDNFSKVQRTFSAFLPLIISLGLVIRTVLKDNASFAQREGFAVFNMLSVGACIALISQIYHLPGNPTAFMLSWMIITVPLVYLLSSSLAACFYLAGITIWAAFSQADGSFAVLFWPLSAVIFPYYIKNVVKKVYSSQWLSAAIFLCFTAAIGICLEKVVPGLWIIIYSAYFGAFFLLSTATNFEHPWTVPFRKFGGLGILILSYMLTYKWPWMTVGFEHLRTGTKFHNLPAVADYLILIASLICAGYFLIKVFRKKNYFDFSFGLMPAVAILAYILASANNGILSAWMFSGYLLVLGILSILNGLKEKKLSLTNMGMFIVGLLILTRFLDFAVGIIVRACVFIFVGVCFIAANKVLSKKIEGGDNVG